MDFSAPTRRLRPLVHGYAVKETLHGTSVTEILPFDLTLSKLTVAQMTVVRETTRGVLSRSRYTKISDVKRWQAQTQRSRCARPRTRLHVF